MKEKMKMLEPILGKIMGFLKIKLAITMSKLELIKE